MKLYFSLIKFSHTIFALPFALSAMLVAAEGFPPLRIFILILICMVSARTAAMAFNRYLDADLDTRNRRTQNREIPRGVISRRSALLLAVWSGILFAVAAGFINPLTMLLSPLALFILFFYSYTKRFTAWSHLFLGGALGIAPIGSWIAVTGHWAWEPVVLGLGVLFWVAGFDIIYATQDELFDKEEGLYSLVVKLGITKALWVARGFHGLTLFFFAGFGWLIFGKGVWPYAPTPYFVALALCALLILYEHRLVKADDLSKVNAAFFNMNGYVSLVFLGGVVLSIL